MAAAFESLVGWRYLFRKDRRPKVLLAGLSALLIGIACIVWSVYAIQAAGGTLQLMGMAPSVERNILYVGVGTLRSRMCCRSIWRVVLPNDDFQRV